jgi:hypothetical protein
MPRGLVRYQQSGCFHFIPFGCYHRFHHLGATPARDLFGRSRENMRIRYDLVVCGDVGQPPGNGLHRKLGNSFN